MILMSLKEKRSVNIPFLTQEPKRMKLWMLSGKLKKLKILKDFNKLDSNLTRDFTILEAKPFRFQESLSEMKKKSNKAKKHFSIFSPNQFMLPNIKLSLQSYTSELIWEIC